MGTASGPSTFSEPNVTMTARRAGPTGWFELAADLELEEHPPWGQGGVLRVELSLQEPQLLRAAKELLSELREFPQRGENPTL
jgi:hypothetical protein